MKPLPPRGPLHIGVNLRGGTKPSGHRRSMSTLQRLLTDMRSADSDCARRRQSNPDQLADPPEASLGDPVPPWGPRPLHSPPGLSVTLEVPPSDPSGAPTPEALIHAIQRHSPAVVAACRAAVAEVHGAQPVEPDGDLEVRLEVDVRGGVSAVALTRSSLTELALEERLLEVLSGVDLDVRLPGYSRLTATISLGPV